MNGINQINERLIKSLPVSLLKHSFDKTGIQHEIITEIVGETNSQQIEDFVFANYGFLKQHVYLYQLNGNFPNHVILPTNPDRINLGNNEIGYKVPVEYSYIDVETREVGVLIFYCPIRISYANNVLKLSVSILERKVDSYFENRVVNLGKDLEEKTIVDEFVASLANSNCQLNRIDITMGVKEIWRQDLIDSPYAKFKKARSTSTEVMDEDFMLKNQYPEVYNQIMQNPIESQIFKFIGVNNYVPKFRVEPTIGRLTFNLFPESNDCVNNTIDLILNNNG